MIIRIDQEHLIQN